MAKLQSKFQNLNAKVDQNVDRQMDGQTDGHHKPKLLCNPAKNMWQKYVILKFKYAIALQCSKNIMVEYFRCEQIDALQHVYMYNDTLKDRNMWI